MKARTTAFVPNVRPPFSVRILCQQRNFHASNIPTLTTHGYIFKCCMQSGIFVSRGMIRGMGSLQYESKMIREIIRKPMVYAFRPLCCPTINPSRLLLYGCNVPELVTHSIQTMVITKTNFTNCQLRVVDSQKMM